MRRQLPRGPPATPPTTVYSLSSVSLSRLVAHDGFRFLAAELARLKALESSCSSFQSARANVRLVGGCESGSRNSRRYAIPQ